MVHERAQRHLREAEIGVAADARRVPRSVHAGGASEFLAVAHPHAVHHLVRERERAKRVTRLLAHVLPHRRICKESVESVACRRPRRRRRALAEAEAKRRNAEARRRGPVRGHRPETVRGDVHRHRRGVQVREARGRAFGIHVVGATHFPHESVVPIDARVEKRVARVRERLDVLERRLRRRRSFRRSFFFASESV